MTAMPAVDAPGPRTVSAMLGMRRDGFLDHVGHLWRTHGDTFALRIGPRTLVFAMHPDAVRHVNVTERRMYDKERSYDTVRKYLTGDGLVASTGALWKRQRKLMAPFFTPRAVREYAETILRDGVRLSDRWDALARDGVRVDMGEEMMRVTAAIILRALFSTEADEAVVDLKGKVETMIAYTTDRAQGLPVPDWVPTRARRRYVTARDSVHASINGMIAERRGLAESAWPDDLLTRLMRARDDAGAAMTEALLRDESLTMFFAGHETTARTLNAAWFALARHPEVASRLHAELDQLGDRTPTASDLDRLPYTLQVVKETLRRTRRRRSTRATPWPTTCWTSSGCPRVRR